MLRNRACPRFGVSLPSRCVTNPSSPFRSPITDDDLMMLPHVASADRHALRAPFGNATKKFSK
jgi:hypothetical protein